MLKKTDDKSTISPHSGSSCVGLAYLIRPVSEQNWQEVITTQLSAPLHAGKRYSVSFWINYSPLSKKHNQTYASPKFGAYLHEKALRTNTDKPLSAPFQIGITHQKIIANEWILVTDFIAPSTDLAYLSIGFWAKPQHTLEAYYYLDDVAVEEVADAPVAVTETKKETLPNLTIKDIGFETGKAELNADAKKLLATFVTDFNLLQFAGTFLIAGHTDNTGNATLNENLSQKRAEAVNNYLLQLGISPAKIRAKGYGATQPIDDNTTENGRSHNRRVQITLEKI